MICWICGKRLKQAVTHKPVAGVVVTVDGVAHVTHKACAKREIRKSVAEKIKERMRVFEPDDAT